MSKVSGLTSQSRLHFNGALSAGTPVSPGRRSALGSAAFNRFLFLLLFLQTSAARQQPRISKKTEEFREEKRECGGGRRRRKDKLKIKLGKRLREVTAYLDTD